MAEMKNLIRGWTRTYSGDGVVLSVPGGQVHLRPSLGPLRPAEEILNEWMPAGVTREGPLAIVNAEGDYGVIANAIAPDEQVTVAILYGEQTYALVHARATDPELYEKFVEVVRRLVHGHSLGLGAERRRPYFYDPPPGWQGVRRAHSTLWVAPDCGHQRATLHVFHARPQRNTIGTLQFRQLFEQLPREFGLERPAEPVTIESRFGMRGQLVTTKGTIAGEPAIVSDAGLTDGRMLYLLRLETAAAVHETHLPLLHACATSVRPIPPPKAAVDVLIEWFSGV